MEKKYFIVEGQRFGRLTILKEIYLLNKRGKLNRYAECLCDCGNTTKVFVPDLFKITKSCGCLHNAMLSERQITHGFSYTHIYDVFKNIKKRCYDPKNKDYKYYGARGISIYPEWLQNSGLFCIWAIKNGYKKGLQIERKNNNDNYTPENCAFVTPIVQQNNSRNNRIIEYNEERLTMAQFCRKYNLNYSMFSQRIRVAKQPVEKAILNCGVFTSVKPYIKIRK